VPRKKPMHAPRNLNLGNLNLGNLNLLVLALGLLLAAGMVHASPPAAAPASTPDYGGRESAPLTTVGDAAPDPAAQAGRALEALVVVLAGVAGVVYLLRRFDLVRPGANGKPARISAPSFGRSPSMNADVMNADVAVVSSQTLPGGTMLHVVRVAGKNLLLAATPQSVTTITEWSVSEAEPVGMADEFEGYLARANPNTNPNSGDPASGIAAANARLRSLLSSQKPEEPS